MDLRFTLLEPDVGRSTDVVVTASTGTPFGDVTPQLLDLLGRRDMGWWIGREQILDSAVLGMAPLLDGAALALSATAPARATAPGVLQLRVISGPDSGAVHCLGPGEHTIGRSGECRATLDDSDVSRAHAVIEVGATRSVLRDLGSTNGTELDGNAVDRDGTALTPGARMRVGQTVLTAVVPDGVLAATREDGCGNVEVNRPPRLVPATPEVTVTLPATPHVREKPRIPVVAMVVPMAIGAVFAVLLDPMYALFLLLSPVMLLGNYVSERWSYRKTAAQAWADHAVAVVEARSCIDRAVREEVSRRRASAPDPAELLLMGTGPTPRLWERRRVDNDFLAIRVGTGNLPSEVLVRDASAADRAVVRQLVEDVPVTLSLPGVGVLGIAGTPRRVSALARHIVAQIAALHSPRDVELVLLVTQDGSAEQWSWARWLPHLRPTGGEACRLLLGADERQVATRVTELLTTVEARRAARSPTLEREWTGRRTVLILDRARMLRSVPGVARLLDDGPAVGIYAVCLDTDPAALPAECGAIATIDEEHGAQLRLSVGDEAPVPDVIADLVSVRWAERFARGLAPLRDATRDGGAADLPHEVRLLDLLPGEVTDFRELAARWSRQPRSTMALLGLSGDGPWTIDLARDGPHGLIAGTTGSGKSELLQTLVASLAVDNRPDEMAFLLVDYKGGSAFKECARLPHTVGMVTDLDSHLTERALASLHAELRRREQLLSDHGAKDIEDYLAAVRPETAADRPGLPRLVLVVDEFATLAEELPDFVGGLVGIAQRGRSLGVHLILATQRPAGVVTADIRANTNLRVALRVTDPEDSMDVVEIKDAALIRQDTPGRAWARTGAGHHVAFQSARIGGHGTPAARTSPQVRRVSWEQLGEAVPPEPLDVAWEEPTDLARLVDATRAAAAYLGVPGAETPWLPPLPTSITLDSLPATAGTVLPIGLSDIPTEQRWAVFALDLVRGSHLLIAGGPGSGRTTALRTVAAAAARLDVMDVHLYGVDGGSGALAPLSQLPHCGTVVTRDQTARGDRLFTRLLAEVARRQDILARGSFASIAEQRAASPPDERLPWMVLLIDGWEGVVAAYDDLDHGRPVDVLLRILREGGPVGVRAVVAGDRMTLTGRLGAIVRDRLLLRFADPGDFALAGIPARLVPPAMPPGRGLVADGIVETQVALLDAEPRGAAQMHALQRIAAAARAGDRGCPPDRRPIRVESLPTRVPVLAVTDEAAAASTGQMWALLGVGGDDLRPVGVDLERDARAFLVAGPPGSGRSTVLRTMGRWLSNRGVQIAVVAPGRSPLCDLDADKGVSGPFGPDDAAALRDALDARTAPLVVLVDDVESVAGTPVESVLSGIGHRTGSGSPLALVVAGDATDMMTAFRGITVEVRRSRCGLLLAPTGGIERDLLGVRVGTADEACPGRGVLVTRGRTLPVQVAE